MNIVGPIRDEKKIKDIKIYLKGQDIRNYALFTVGINVALRISDLLLLRWHDALNENKKSFKSIKLKEGKTGKNRDIKLNKTAQKALRELLDGLDIYDMNDFIFKSREGGNKPITR